LGHAGLIRPQSRRRFRKKLLAFGVTAKLPAMKFLDPHTERAVRAFLARLPADVRLDHAILYGSRARGEDRPDSDADVALIIAEGTADWELVGTLAELAYDVFLDSGILIQPVPVSLTHWLHPERFPRPGFLRNIAREGIVL
jgi:predicted nucleotidyltransferase